MLRSFTSTPGARVSSTRRSRDEPQPAAVDQRLEQASLEFTARSAFLSAISVGAAPGRSASSRRRRCAAVTCRLDAAWHVASPRGCQASSSQGSKDGDGVIEHPISRQAARADRADLRHQRIDGMPQRQLTHRLTPIPSTSAQRCQERPHRTSRPRFRRTVPRRRRRRPRTRHVAGDTTPPRLEGGRRWQPPSTLTTLAPLSFALP